jgi:hypothetical protein
MLISRPRCAGPAGCGGGGKPGGGGPHYRPLPPPHLTCHPQPLRLQTGPATSVLHALLSLLTLAALELPKTTENENEILPAN